MLSQKFIKVSDEMCDFDHHVPAPYLRKTFDLDFVPETAEITVCGLGFYEIYVNGKEITKGPLAPYISNPDHICYYDKYDLAPYLRVGKNAIGFLLGNGFRNGFGGFIWDFQLSKSRGPVVLALHFLAAAKDKKVEFEADESFRTHPSPVTFDDERMGCRYDARLEIPHWCEPDFDDGAWAHALSAEPPRGEAKLCDADPIAVRRELHPVKITHYDELPFAYEGGNLENANPLPASLRKNVYVYDFGENTAGVSVLRIRGAKRGQVITVRHGEATSNGKFNESTTLFIRPDSTDLYLEYAQTDVYTCRGGEEEEVFVPKFSYDGFRYCFVEGLTPEQATPDALTYRVMSSALRERAGFSSSSETLNKLFEMARRSDLANFFYFPTDCPHREKNGWTGDASSSCEQFLINLDAGRSLRVWMDNIRKAQREDGNLPGLIPTGGWGFHWGNGPMWDSICVSIPYYLYRFYGDPEVIRENVEIILRYLSFATTKKDGNGLLSYGLGDWLDPFEYSRNPPRRSCPDRVCNTAIVYRMADRAAFLFEIIGRTREAEFARGVAADLREAFRAHLIDRATMTVDGDCQSSQAIAIEVGMFDEDELPAARKTLLSIVERDNYANTCGLIGLRYIYNALIHAGRADVAVRILTSEARSCPGHWVKLGLTALPETFFYPDGRERASLNHHFFGHFTSVMVQDFAGIRPNPHWNDPDFFEVSPVFPENLDFADAWYDAEKGRLSVSWKRDKDGILLTVNAPAGMRGEVVLGSRREPLRAGTSEYRV